MADKSPLDGLMEAFGMVSANKAEDLDKANPELIQELRRYFQPRSEFVQALPDVNTVIDMTEVILKDSNGSYVLYKMVEGKWIPFAQY